MPREKLKASATQIAEAKCHQCSVVKEARLEKAPKGSEGTTYVAIEF